MQKTGTAFRKLHRVSVQGVEKVESYSKTGQVPWYVESALSYYFSYVVFRQASIRSLEAVTLP